MILKIVDDQVDARCTLAAFVLRNFRPPLISRRHARRCINSGFFTINDSPANCPGINLAAGDKVELLASSEQLNDALAQNHALEVLAYESGCYAVLLKPPGMPVRGDGACTVERLMPSSISASDPTHLLTLPGSPMIINSAGRPVLGPVLVGLSARTSIALQNAYLAGECVFVYRVVVHGRFSDASNATSPGFQEFPAGLFRITVVRHVISTGGPLSILDVTTSKGDGGLRRKFSSMGYPIVGNAAGTRPSKGSYTNGILLTCKWLSFPVPNMQSQHNEATKRIISVPIPVAAKFENFARREARFSENKARALQAKAETASALFQLNGENNEFAGELQRAEFCGLLLYVSDAVMIPRSSSELLVDTACGLLNDMCKAWFRKNDANDSNACNSMRVHRLLDLGTGSGALLIATLVRCRGIGAIGVGVDISEKALDVARVNVAKWQLDKVVELVRGDFGDLSCLKGVGTEFEKGSGTDYSLDASRSDITLQQLTELQHTDGFDMVLCNPPYLTMSEADRLGNELNGPALAMVAQDQVIEGRSLKGMSCYYRAACGIGGSGSRDGDIYESEQEVLRPGGTVLVELGNRRDVDAIVRIFEEHAGLALVDRHHDHYGFLRCLQFVKSST